MARLQLLFPLLFWYVWVNNGDAVVSCDPLIGTAAYLGLLLGILGFVWLRLRRAMRTTTINKTAAIPGFHKVLFAARWAFLLAHFIALFFLGYGYVVAYIVPTFHGRADVLQAFASLIPIVFAWIGLLNLQYPLERAIREQNALYAFEFGEPVHIVPTRLQYVVTGVRQQILFTLLPMAVAAALRDVLHVAAAAMHYSATDNLDLVISIIAVAFVFIFAPEILRRVLQTEPLPPSLLRTRLEKSCHDLGLKYRDILLWRTHHTLANAAVMGVFPQVRYVLLSDRLIETMTEQHTEAVFAHEAGHIFHRHLAWYSAFFLIFILAMAGGDQLGEHVITQWGVNRWAWGCLEFVVALGCFFGGFGALSRSFERQADVFAARCVPETAINSPIQPAGVAAFSGALLHVARLNNIPIHAGDYFDNRSLLPRLYGRVVHHAGAWLHGSILSRIEYLERLVNNPAEGARFDRLMIVIRVSLIVALGACVAWVATTMR